MAEFLLAFAVILLVLVTWIAVERAYERFARRHPKRGPFRQGGTCGSCSCGGDTCSKTDAG